MIATYAYHDGNVKDILDIEACCDLHFDNPVFRGAGEHIVEDTPSEPQHRITPLTLQELTFSAVKRVQRAESTGCPYIQVTDAADTRSLPMFLLPLLLRLQYDRHWEETQGIPPIGFILPRIRGAPVFGRSAHPGCVSGCVCGCCTSLRRVRVVRRCGTMN